jgi:hypothetical protein
MEENGCRIFLTNLCSIYASESISTGGQSASESAKSGAHCGSRISMISCSLWFQNQHDQVLIIHQNQQDQVLIMHQNQQDQSDLYVSELERSGAHYTLELGNIMFQNRQDQVLIIS